MAELTHHAPVIVDEHYTFTPLLRKRLFIALGIGVLLFVAGILLLIFMPHESAHGAEAGGAVAKHAPVWRQRLWANLWLNNVYFSGIALIGVFFVAIQYVAYAGWSASIKRIPEAFGYFLPIGAVMMLIIFFLGGHDLFHWTHEYLYEPTLANGQPNPDYDEIIANKRGFLNTPFFVIRMLLYFGAWYFLHRLLRKESLQEDLDGNIAHYDRSITLSAI